MAHVKFAGGFRAHPRAPVYMSSVEYITTPHPKAIAPKEKPPLPEVSKPPQPLQDRQNACIPDSLRC